MAKNSIRDFSATAGSNTDIQSVNIDENCPASGINNAIRELMVDLKNVSTGAVNLETPAADSLTVAGDLTVDTNTLKVDSSNNRVGIGTTSPATTLHISGNSNNTAALSDTVTDFALKFDSATTTNNFSNAICFAEGTNVNASIASFDGGSGGAQGLVFGTGASNTERLRIDSSGNVGIGISTITTGTLGTSNKFIEAAGDGGSGTLVLSRDTSTDNDEVGGIRFVNRNNADDDGLDADGKLIAGINARIETSDSNAGDDSGGHLIFSTKPEAGSYAERIRLDASGHLLHNTTNVDVFTTTLPHSLGWY